MRQIEFFAVYESSLDGSSSNFGIACWWEIAVTAQLSLNWRTLGPSWISHQQQKKRNLVEDHPVIIPTILQFLWWWLGDPLPTFLFLCGSEIQNGRHQAIYFTIEPYGNFIERPFCEKLLDKLNILHYLNNKLGRGPPSHHFYDVKIPSAE
jgi:hypothetical protein